MKLSNLPGGNNIKKSKRVGRGIGSGKGGHTVGKGTKGQKSRKGTKFTLGFEGGQVPLYKRLPHLGGFKNKRSKDVYAINLDKLNIFKDGDIVTPKLLREKGIVSYIPKDGIKILSTGKIEKKIILKDFLYSKNAKAKISKSGSKIND